MSILISPILIDGTRYCVDEQDDMRTTALFDGDASDTGGNTFVVASFGASGTGSVRFGTICATSVEVSLNTDGALVDAIWTMRVNGTIVHNGAASYAEIDLSRTLSLTPAPCGNLIEVSAAIADGIPSSAVIAMAIAF
jgi:hypothetical protein